MNETVDLTEARQQLVEALKRVDQMQGLVIPGENQHRDRVKALAETQRQLLYLAYLCERANTLVLGEYHLVRGFTDHLPK